MNKEEILNELHDGEKFGEIIESLKSMNDLDRLVSLCSILDSIDSESDESIEKNSSILDSFHDELRAIRKASNELDESNRKSMGAMLDGVAYEHIDMFEENVGKVALKYFKEK